MTSASRTILAVILLPAATSCGDAAVRDSPWPDTANDLAVVRNDRPGESTPVWRLPLDSASLVLGDDEDGGDFFVNPFNAMRLNDGRVAVQDYDEWPLKIYSPEGGLVGRFREGHGPRELPPSGFMAFAVADTIIAGDFRTGPVKLIDPSLMRVARIQTRPGRLDTRAGVLAVDKLDDGRWLIVRHPRDQRYPGGDAENYRFEYQWVLYESDFSTDRMLLRYPGTEVVHRTNDRTGEFAVNRRIFGRQTAQALHGGRLYLATNDAPEIEVRDTTGRVTLRIRVDLPIEAVTAEDREEYVRTGREFRSRGGRRPPSSFREELREATFASSHSFFRRLAVGSDGLIWAALAERVVADPTDYLIFSPQGALLATASSPPRVWLWSVGPDAIVVTASKPDDEPLIKVVPIRR